MNEYSKNCINDEGITKTIVITGENFEVIPQDVYLKEEFHAVDLVSQLLEVIGHKTGIQKGSMMVLDLGGTCVGDEPGNSDYMLTQLLLENPFVSKAISVDLRMPHNPAHQKLTVLGDVLEPSVREQIQEVLGGNPNVIVASQILIKDIAEYMSESGMPVIGEAANYGQRLAKTSWKMLQNSGLLVVDNIEPFMNSDENLLPFLMSKRRNLAFLDEKYLTRVYKK